MVFVGTSAPPSSLVTLQTNSHSQENPRMYTIIGSDGLQYGPVDSMTLQTWASMGRVTPTTLITIQDTNEQVNASQIPFLQAFFLSPPAYPQPYFSNVDSACC